MTITAFYGGLGPANDSTNSPLNADAVSAINNAGFNTVILSLFHIGRPGVMYVNSAGQTVSQMLGDIVFNHSADIVATGGILQTDYVGTPGSQEDWAYYVQQLKAGGVEKVYLSFGGAGPDEGGNIYDFTTISTIMEYQDPVNQKNPYIPQSSDLYKNFVVLQQYLSMVDGIDLDQEEYTNQTITDAMTAFGTMAIDVGFREITMVPPGDQFMTCYQNAGYAINNAVGNSVVTRIGLQFYGQCSNITAWEQAAQYISTGTAPVLYSGATAGANPPNNTPPQQIFQTLQQYANTAANGGGFIWEYNFISSDLFCYWAAMSLAFAPTGT